MNARPRTRGHRGLPMVGFAIFLAVALGVAWLFVARARTTRRARPPRQAAGRLAPAGAKPAARNGAADVPPDVQLARLRRDDSFWGVMVQFPAGQGCVAAREVRDRKFDIDRAPSLPLRGCDAQQCRCGYLGLKERRRKDVLPPEADDRRNTGIVEWDIHKS